MRWDGIRPARRFSGYWMVFPLINTELNKGVPEDKKKEFEQTLRASTTLLETLHRVLRDRMERLQQDEARTTDYDSPAWPYKQANRNGRYTSYQELLALFTFKKD